MFAALHMASANGHADIVTLLLDAKAVSVAAASLTVNLRLQQLCIRQTDRKGSIPLLAGPATHPRPLICKS
jgi:ankyrin repeat protein